MQRFPFDDAVLKDLVVLNFSRRTELTYARITIHGSRLIRILFCPITRADTLFVPLAELLQQQSVPNLSDTVDNLDPAGDH